MRGPRRHVAAYGHLAVAVQAVDLGGALAGDERDHVAQGHDVVLGRGDGDRGQLREPVADLGGGPHVDLVLFAFLVVVAGLVAGHQQPQGVGHVGDRDAQVGGLGAIDRHAVLRLAHHQ